MGRGVCLVPSTDIAAFGFFVGVAEVELAKGNLENGLSMRIGPGEPISARSLSFPMQLWHPCFRSTATGA